MPGFDPEMLRPQPEKATNELHTYLKSAEFYLLDGDLKVGGLVVELAPDVDVGGPGAHGPPRNEATLHQLVRVMPHNLPVLKRKKHIEKLLTDPVR